jgi:hypothetical protein
MQDPGENRMGYRIVFTNRAEKDTKKLEQAGLDKKAKEFLRIIRDNPLFFIKVKSHCARGFVVFMFYRVFKVFPVNCL